MFSTVGQVNTKIEKALNFCKQTALFQSHSSIAPHNGKHRPITSWYPMHRRSFLTLNDVDARAVRDDQESHVAEVAVAPKEGGTLPQCKAGGLFHTCGAVTRWMSSIFDRLCVKERTCVNKLKPTVCIRLHSQELLGLFEDIHAPVTHASFVYIYGRANYRNVSSEAKSQENQTQSFKREKRWRFRLIDIKHQSANIDNPAALSSVVDMLS